VFVDNVDVDDDDDDDDDDGLKDLIYLSLSILIHTHNRITTR
jgi:hypothetical protein